MSRSGCGGGWGGSEVSGPMISFHIGKVKVRWKLFPKEGTGSSANCLPEPKQRDDKAGKTNCGGAEHPGQGDLHLGGGGQGKFYLGGGQQPCQGGGGRGGVRHPPLPHQDGQFEELKIATVLKDNTYCSPFKHNDQGVYKYRLWMSHWKLWYILWGGRGGWNHYHVLLHSRLTSGKLREGGKSTQDVSNFWISTCYNAT